MTQFATGTYNTNTAAWSADISALFSSTASALLSIAYGDDIRYETGAYHLNNALVLLNTAHYHAYTDIINTYSGQSVAEQTSTNI